MADPVTWLLVGSSAIQGFSAIQSGRAAQTQYEYQAKLAEREAQQTRAFGEVEAAKKRREGRLAESRQRAIAAASGGAGDPSVLNILATTEAEAQYASDMERFRGKAGAAGRRLQAQGLRLRGQSARQQGLLTGLGNFLQAGGTYAEANPTAFERFGRQNEPQKSNYTYG